MFKVIRQEPDPDVLPDDPDAKLWPWFAIVAPNGQIVGELWCSAELPEVVDTANQLQIQLNRGQ